MNFRKKQRVDARVRGQLRMERRHQVPAQLHQHRIALVAAPAPRALARRAG